MNDETVLLLKEQLRIEELRAGVLSDRLAKEHSAVRSTVLEIEQSGRIVEDLRRILAHAGV